MYRSPFRWVFIKSEKPVSERLSHIVENIDTTAEVDTLRELNIDFPPPSFTNGR